MRNAVFDYHPGTIELESEMSVASVSGPFDYIIVGAGTAGCVLANRLSAKPYTAVLLVEAGGPDDYFWIDVPVGYLSRSATRAPIGAT